MTKEELINYIIKNGLNQSSLNALADFFGFEACGIGIVKDFKVEEYFLSSFFAINKVKINDLYKNLAYKTSVVSQTIKKGYYIALDYQNDENSYEDWKNIGLKSTIMVKLQTTEISILAFANFKDQLNDFNNSNLTQLLDVAKLLTYIVESYINEKKLLEYLNALKSVKPIYSYNQNDIENWVGRFFSSVIRFIKTKLIFYFFPKYDIYYIFKSLDDDIQLYKLQEKEALSASLMYALYKQKPNGICGQRNITSNNCMLDKSNALFVPVYKDNELLSICAYSYDFDLDFQNDTMLLLDTLSNLVTNQIENLNQIGKIAFFYQMLASANEIMISETDPKKLISIIIKLMSNMPQIRLGLVVINNKLVDWWVKDKFQLKVLKLALREKNKELFYSNILQKVVETNDKVVENHFITSEKYAESSDFAKKLELDCCAAFPIRAHSKPLGAFIIFGAYDAFNSDTLELLQNLVNNLSNKLYIIKLESLRLKNKKKIEFLAYNDALTKISNRAFFEKRLSQMIAVLNRSNRKIALTIMDLDDFKGINDNYGHDIGDKLLIEVSKRLKNTVRTEDTLSRLGGDEFALLCDTFESIQDLEILVKRIIKAISEPFNLNQFTVTIGLSIGVAYALTPTTKEKLFKKADEALYISKSKQKNTYTILRVS
jgi:diguanylate cyclase (GGDEF)-like protein